MAFRERIELLVDVATGQSTPTLRRLRTDLADADGAFGKLRVGAGAAFDFLSQHAATAAAAAAGALATFAVKAIGDFQDTALGAGQLRDALGVTAEEASKLQEVAGDLSIGVDALQSTIGRMNRTAATTPEAFDEIGAAIKRNADGTINVTETFLSTVDALNKIPDASRRADAAQQIFGRSWQDISELVASGADGVREALASVEDSKIIDDAEVAKARRFRDLLDELKGKAEAFTLTVGGGLVDAINDFDVVLGRVSDKLAFMPDAPEWMTDKAVSVLTPAIGALKALDQGLDALAGSEIEASVAAEDWTQKVDMSTEAGRNAIATVMALSREIGNQEDAVDDATDAVDEMASATQNLDRKWAALKGQVSDDQAWVDIQDSLADVESAAAESWGAASSGAADAAAKARDHQSAVNNLKDRVIEYGRSVAGISPRQVSEIVAMIDEGRLREAERRLNDLARARNVQVRAAAVGNFERVGHTGRTFGPEHDSMIVGRAGAEERVVFDNFTHQSGTIESTETMRRNASGRYAVVVGGNTLVFNITAGMGANAYEIARVVRDAIAQDVRNNGYGGYRRILGIKPVGHIA